MSGTGKSAVIAALAEQGVRAVDADVAAGPDGAGGGPPWITTTADPTAPTGVAHLLDTAAVRRWFAAHPDEPLVLAVTTENQGELREQLSHVVLLTAPAEVLLQRLATRTGNPYGRTDSERDEVLGYLQTVEPLLRRGADVVIDTGATPPAAVVAAVRELLG